MQSYNRRSGFTLIEILIVLGIIVAVAAIFVPVVLNLSERNQVPKAASLLENSLSIAKSHAIAERRPSGIRLIATNNALRTTTGGFSFAWYDEIQFIEDPGDYVNGWVWGFGQLNVGSPVVEQPFWSRPTPIPSELPAGFDLVTVAANIPNFTAQTFTGPQTIDMTVIPRSRLLFGPISPIVSGTDNNQWIGNSGTARPTQRMAYNWYARTPVPAQPGDMVEITGVGELYQVVAVSLDQAGGNNNTNVNISGNGNAIRVPILVLDRPLKEDIVPSRTGAPNFRIIRQPRVISSMPPLKLPQDVVIDFTIDRSTFPGATNLDTTNAFFMSNVSIGANVTGITGITTTAPNLFAPLYIDIMFAPSGEVMPTSQVFRNGTAVGSFSVGSSGLIAMWLHSRGDPNLWANRLATAAQGNADNQALVSINARTGFIGSYPMTPLSISTDPLLYVRTGKARISADTGQ